jgi:arylsulfatase A-like enzyme
MNRHRHVYSVICALFPLLLSIGAAHAQAAAGAQSRPNVVVLIADDVRFDALGAAGNPVVQTPTIDRLAAEGVRFTHAYVTTSICWVSRASILTGQHMARHGHTTAAEPFSPEAWASTYPAVFRGAGYWTGWIGKWHNGKLPADQFDYARSYPMKYWIDDPRYGHIHVTDADTRDALEFLRQRPKDRPFQLNVAFFNAHAEDAAKEQYLPEDSSASEYRDVTIPPPLRAGSEYFDALPFFLKAEANEGRVRYHWRFDTPASYQEMITNYYRLISDMDRAISMVVAELKAQGVYDNTLILFIGDNGYFQADRGLADKWYPYEESVRVPLVIHDPRVREGGVTRDQTVLNIDLAPTILAAAGLRVPAVMQGRDMGPLYLSARAPAWRDEFFYDHPTITSRDRIPASQAVVRRDLKYVIYPEWGYEQLFDLKKDPTELHNLVEDSGYRAVLQSLRRKLEEWREKVR